MAAQNSRSARRSSSNVRLAHAYRVGFGDQSALLSVIAEHMIRIRQIVHLPLSFELLGRRRRRWRRLVISRGTASPEPPHAVARGAPRSPAPLPRGAPDGAP
jgi:hypothetical protein